MRPALPALALALALVAGAAHAQLYRWIDEQGRVRYTDTPPPASAKGVQKKRLVAGPAEADAAGNAFDEAVRKNPVTLYTSGECVAPCRDARAVLDGRGIPYREVVVRTAEDIETMRRALGRAQVPSLLVGTSPRIGFLAQDWQAALDAAGYPKAPPPGRAGAARASPQPPLPEVKLYTNSQCGQLCTEAKSFLDGRGVKYQEIEVEDEAAFESLRQVSGGASVPVLVVGKSVLKGFNPERDASVLEAAGFPKAQRK